jgi:hypothetical protein
MLAVLHHVGGLTLHARMVQHIDNPTTSTNRVGTETPEDQRPRISCELLLLLIMLVRSRKC